MSGEYRVRGDDEVMRPDGTRLVWSVIDSEAEETVDELNRLAASSPEGWPEGAEVHVVGDFFDDEAADWEVAHRTGGGSLTFRDMERGKGWRHIPMGTIVLARRKPKPVTRTEDVRAEELRPGMKPEGMKHADGSQVTLWKVLLTEVDGGLRVSAWSKTGVQTIFAVDAEQPIPVLVEEPNG